MDISIDKNVISELKEEFLKNKLSPALGQNKIILHLTEPLLGELLLDGNGVRRGKQANVLKKIFNGKIILSLPDLIRYELGENSSVFYGSSEEMKWKKLLSDIAQQKSLSDFEKDQLGNEIMGTVLIFLDSRLKHSGMTG